MKFKAAVFDMDGTLIDSLMFWSITWKEFGKKFLNDENFVPSAADEKAVRTISLRSSVELIHKNYGIGNSADELEEEAKKITMDLYSSRVQLKDGVKEFLDYCYDSGTKMCIATATAPYFVDIALKHCKIEKYFKKIFSCSEIGKGKDSPDIFLAAQEYMGFPVCDTWVFEDSEAAIQTAVKAGFNTVGIYDKFNFGHENIKKLACEYIDKGETLAKLIQA